MMQMALSNAVHPEYGVVTISFPIPEEEYGHCLELLEALEIGNAVNRDCKVQEVQDGPPILKRLEGSRVNLDELDYLAKRLDSFTDQELAQFQSAAVSYNYSNIVDLINLTFSCQEVTVITDFSDLESIGRNHYMTLNGGSARMEELDNLDGTETALLLIESGDGVITPYGVVYDNCMRLSQDYDGRHLPEYYYTLLWFDIQPTKLSPLVVKHPFTDSGLVGIRNEDGSLSAGNLLDDPGALHSWRENVRQQINEAETAAGLLLLVTKPYRLGYLKLAAPYLCEQDAALFLSYAWISTESPNDDPNLSKRSLLAMFRSIDPQMLMDEEERGLFQSLDDVVTVYRGVTSYNAQNVKALSWTLNREVAEWFAHRFGQNGTVYEAQVKKENIYAVFLGRNEEEVIVDPERLMGLSQLPEQEQGQGMEISM